MKLNASLILFILIRNIDLINLTELKRKKGEKSLFQLNEIDDTKSTTKPTKFANNTDALLQETKENLILAFGLRKSMLRIGDKLKKRQPHNFMLYISKKFEKEYKSGVLQAANTVRGCSDLGQSRRRLADFPHIAFKFDISEIPTSETLIQSALKVLMKTPGKNNVNSRTQFNVNSRTQFNVNSRTQFKNGVYKVTLFGVYPRRRENKGHIFPVLIEVHSRTIQIVRGQADRWINFDISSFVPGIQGLNRRFIKFVLRVKAVNGGTAIDPEILGIKSHHEEETDKSLLVLFTGDDIDNSCTNSRKKRGVSSSPESKGARSRRREKRRRKKKKNKHRKKKACRRKPMIVQFSMFKWHNWLLHPTQYNAYHCHGQCKYPVATHLKATNHATIQSIIHSMNRKFVPPPCCVPDEFDVLPVLSLDGPDRVVFRLKEGLIVKSCACR